MDVDDAIIKSVAQQFTSGVKRRRQTVSRAPAASQRQSRSPVKSRKRQAASQSISDNECDDEAEAEGEEEVGESISAYRPPSKRARRGARGASRRVTIHEVSLLSPSVSIHGTQVY